MTTLVNPYLNRTAISNDRDFFGRRRELATLFSRIEAPAPQSVSIVGERRVGKSSLLRALLRQQTAFLRRPDGFVFVFLDLQEKMHADVAHFFASLLEETALASRDRSLAGQPPTYESVRKLAMEFQRRRLRLVLLFDEFEALTQNRSFTVEFFNFLRSLPNNYPVSFIVTSARELQELCHSKEISGSPFFNIFHKLTLGCFQPGEAKELIEQPSRAAGFPLEPYSAFIVRMAGCFPFFLQLSCSAFFEYFAEHGAAEKPDLKAVWQMYYDQVRDHFEYLWQHLSERDRAVCLKVRGREELNEADRRFLAVLKRRGYVQQTDSRPLLFSDVFDIFVESKTPVEDGARAGRARAGDEMQIAMQVQARLFPQKAPPLATLDYAGRCIQAREVGGDYYDFLDLGHGRVGLVLADIAGKGISAALLMANLQANLRSPYASGVDDLPRFLESVNRLFYDSTSDGHFATLFFAIYEDANRRLCYANCGHNPALLLRADGRLERLSATTTVVGLFEKWECLIGVAELAAGDTLVVFTDGITEAMSGAKEEFGEARLLQAISANRHLPVSALLAHIVDTVRQFSGSEQQDDLTLLVARAR